MPDPWMPTLIHDPGTGAGYNAGRNAMQFVVLHDTGGTNSHDLCKNGRPGYNSSLCNILIPKDGAPWQFAEIDAETYHIGSSSDYDHDGQPDDFNGWAPGIEVERLQGEALTDSQVEWLGEIVTWLHDEWGVPVVHFAGAFGAVEQFRGFVNHRDIHPNPDGLSPEEWDLVIAQLSGPAPAPFFGGDMDMYVGQFAQKTEIGPIPVPANTPVALLCAPSGRIISTWAGAGPYGVPQGAADWRAAGGGRDRVNPILLDPAQMAQIIAADAVTRVVPSPGGPAAPVKVTSTVTSVLS